MMSEKDMYLYVLLLTFMYFYVLVCTLMYIYVHLCSFMYIYILIQSISSPNDVKEIVVLFVKIVDKQC